MFKKGLLILCILPGSLLAVPLDSNYFTFYKNDVILGLYSSTDLFTLKQINQNERTVIFKPNQYLSGGLGLAYRWLAVYIGIDYADLTESRIYGKSTVLSLAVGATINKTSLRFSLQNYSGFYLENYSELGLNMNPNGLIPNLPNMNMNTINLGYAYYFNGDKFSIAPYTTGNSVMTKNCGSFILSANLAYYSLKNDSSFVSSASKFQAEQRIKSLISIAPYISAGYGQNFILSKDISVILIANAGIGSEKMEYKTITDDVFTSTNSSFRLDGFGGILYNKPNFFFSLTSEFSFIEHRVILSSFETNMNRLTLNFGYRIKTKSRMKWIGNKIGL